MEVIPKPRKHNRLSSPVLSTVTRSRSQSLLHRNRSGHIRSDPIPKKKAPYYGLVHGNGAIQESSDLEDDVLIKGLRKKVKRDDEDLSRRLAKDLRARRVYSPPSNAGASDQKIADLGFVSTPSAEISDVRVDDVMMSATIEPAKSSDLGLSCEARNYDLGNTESSYEIEKLQDHMQVDGKDGKEIDDLGEEPVQKTPPDAVICGNLKVNGDVEKMEAEEELRVNGAPFAENAGEISGEGLSGKDGQLNGSVPRSKSVLGPRLPGRLFKAIGSVSYRKLFPFLMDIMGDDSGTPKLGHCHKDEKGMDTPGFQFSLSSQSNEVSKHEPKTNSFTNGSNLTSSPMQLDAKEATGECLPVLSVDDKCVSESKADPNAVFHGAKDVGNALDNDDFKQNSLQENKLDHAKTTNNSGLTSEQIPILNQDCVLTTPDAEINDNSVVNADQFQSMPRDMCHVKPTDAGKYDNSAVNVDKLQSMPEDMCHAKPMDLTGSTQGNIFEGCCPKADKRNDLPLTSKYVPRPRLHGRLFKTPGSVSYKRLLPFLMGLDKDDSGTSKCGDRIHHKINEADMYANGFQLPLSSQSEEASINGQMTVSVPMDAIIESKALENNNLVNPADELSHGYQPKLTSSLETTELPMQLDAEVVHKCLSASSVKQHFEKVVVGSKDECLSDSKFDPCSRTVDFHCARIVANAAQSDVCNQVENEISGQHYSRSPPKGQNMLYINGDISDLTFEHHSSKEKEFTSDYEGRKQFLNQEKHESVSSCSPEGQSLSQLGPNMLDVKNETSSLATSKSEDALVLNHVSVPNEPITQPSAAEKTDTVLYINGDISDLTFEYHSSKEKEFTNDYEGRKQFLNLEKHESLSICPPESQSLSQLGPNMLDVKNETSSLATSKSEDALVLNHVSVPNEPITQPSAAEKTDTVLYINGDISDLTFEHHSSKEKEFTNDYEGRKQFLNLEKHESLSICPPEGQSLSQLGPNMLDVKNETSSLATSKSEDALVLNHVSVPNEPRPQPSEKITAEKTDNMLYINVDISGLTFEHHSSKEKEFTSDYEGRKQFLDLEKPASVSSCPPQDQSLSQLGPNMLDVKNETNSLATSKSDDALVLNHVSVPNEPRPQPSEKITAENTDMAAHGGDKAGSVLKGLVYGSRMPSKGSNNKHASRAGEIQYGSKSNILQVLKRCPRNKMLNHAGSFSYKRLLPFMINNSRNSGTQQETRLQACDLKNDSSSSRSQIPLINDPIITRKDATSSLSEVIRNGSFPISSNEKKPPPETHRSCQSLSQLRVTEKLRVHAVGFKKGILKRNPRGCRGLCTCLRCVSFRLHAERAFEFSSNQLLDAEELAQDLMKELSHLRNLLERSTDSVSNSLAFDGSQVKEACRKASETEQLANDRLSQMKDDLNVHCRIPNLQRPQVKFSDHVEEKIIQSDR